MWFRAVYPVQPNGGAMNTDPGLLATVKRDVLREAAFLLDLYTHNPPVAAAFVCALSLAASILMCFVVYMCQWRAAQRRRRENALAVRLAEIAPDDDEWEHEMEKQTNALRAAPSESEDEEAGRVLQNDHTRVRFSPLTRGSGLDQRA